MNWDTIRNRGESTPFKVIELPEGRIDLYWSKNAGTYGHQVYMFVIDHSTYSWKDGTEARTLFSKSSGYGYCKESQETQLAFEFLGVMPKNYQPGCEVVPHKYRKGGNFYKIPKSELVKYK